MVLLLWVKGGKHYTISVPANSNNAYLMKNDEWSLQVNIKKTDSETGNQIAADAQYEIFQWDTVTGKYQPTGGYNTYSVQRQGDGTYAVINSAAYATTDSMRHTLYYTQRNTGKFIIVESKAPTGYFGDWTDINHPGMANTPLGKRGYYIEITEDSDNSVIWLDNADYKVTGYLTQKHGFYYVVLNLPTDEKGKRNRKTLSTGLSTDRNATKAKALLLTMIREANAGEEVRGVNERQPKSQNKTEDERWNSPWPGMLFSDYLEFWLQWKRKSWEEVTYSGYCQNVRSWIEPYFAKRKVRLNEITVLDIEMFYTHEINQRGVSGNTVLHYHANIRKALSDAAKLKLIPYNPAAEVERPKKDNFVASYYSADELMEVLPIFANTKMELPVMLAAFYGLRRSEVIGLQWSAIDFERKIVTISRTFERINVDGKMVDVSKCRTKNKASFRSLPLIPAVEQALLKAQKRQHQQMKLCGGSYCKEYKDYICVDDMGHLVTPDYVTRVFREMLLKNGFRPIRYHDLRHSCASLLIKNKVTMKEVQMWLGHSSFSTTANIYAHIDVDSKMEAANMIASKINLGELPEKKKSPKRKIA